VHVGLLDTLTRRKCGHSAGGHLTLLLLSSHSRFRSSAYSVLGLSNRSHIASIDSGLMSSHSSSGHTVLGFGAEVINELNIVFRKVWLPYHYDWVVFASRAEVISTGREISGVAGTLVSIKCIEDVSLSQVPHLNGRVGWGGKQVTSVSVERDIVHVVVMSIVVLD